LSTYQNTAPAIYILWEGFRPIYVGKSRNVKNRWRQHRGALKRGEHENSDLQDAYNNRSPSAPWRFTTHWVMPDEVAKVLDKAQQDALLLSLERSTIDLMRDLNFALTNER